MINRCKTPGGRIPNGVPCACKRPSAALRMEHFRLMRSRRGAGAGRATHAARRARNGLQVYRTCASTRDGSWRDLRSGPGAFRAAPRSQIRSAPAIAALLRSTSAHGDGRVDGRRLSGWQQREPRRRGLRWRRQWQGDNSTRTGASARRSSKCSLTHWARARIAANLAATGLASPAANPKGAMRALPAPDS